MLAIATTDGQLDELHSTLQTVGAQSFEIVEPGGERLVVLATVSDAWETALMASELRAGGFMAVTRPDGGAGLKAWHRNTEPARFGDRLSICLAWSEHDRAGMSNLIELGPGGFGSGHHVTTRMIIEELMQRVSGGERVLDVGCGSGILALAAVALGADHAVGVDLKPEAVEATVRNASLNGLAERVVATAAPLEEIDGPFDIVLANIARAGIVALADELVDHLAEDGHLIVSGIAPRQCEQVTGFLRPLIEAHRRIEGDWAVLVLDRPSASPA